MSDATFEAALNSHTVANGRGGPTPSMRNLGAGPTCWPRSKERPQRCPANIRRTIGTPKLEEVLRLLDLQNEDDPLETLHELAKNKKKPEDMWVLQRAIDDWASTPALAADEYTQPQLSMHEYNRQVLELCMGGHGTDISNGITLFNITFVNEPAHKAASSGCGIIGVSVSRVALEEMVVLVEAAMVVALEKVARGWRLDHRYSPIIECQ